MKILAIICIIFFISCNSNKTYYKGGKIKKIINIENSQLREVFEYDSIGQLSCKYYINKDNLLDSMKFTYIDNKVDNVISFKNNIQTGLSKWYYPNGNIKKTGLYLNGKRIGIHEYYYEDGSIKRLSYNIIEKGESSINNSLIFKNNGQIDLLKSNYFDIILDKDTIKRNEKLGFKIFNLFDKQDSSRGFICDFDKKFIIKDSSKMSYFNIFDHNHLNTKKIFNDTLRVIIEVKKYNIDGLMDSSHCFILRSYLEKAFFVLP